MSASAPAYTETEKLAAPANPSNAEAPPKSGGGGGGCSCAPLTASEFARLVDTSDAAQLPKYESHYSGSNDGLASIADHVDRLSSSLRDVSVTMHDNPEIGWEEFKTTKLLSDYIEKHGFRVTRKAYGTETGFSAVFENGNGGRTIGFNSEMDALPGIGHACGHNLIAIAGLGAAIATAKSMKDHNVSGRVVLLGTPAEEKDGGKIVMLNHGGYKDMDVCLMAHPAPFSALAPMLAVSECVAEFFGHTAHAAGAPWEGVNALDAAVLAYTNISALRQQTHPDSRVHGVILGSEEWVCNVIPGHSKVQFGVRNPKQSEVVKLKGKIDNCLNAAALATGCKVKITWIMQYLDMHNNSVLGGEYQRYMKDEQKTEVPVSNSAFASTDFGDVTYALPALHPMFAIPVGEGSANHTAGFAKAAGKKEAHEATIKTAKGLGAVAWRILNDDRFAEAAKREYEEHRKPERPEYTAA